MKNLSDDEYDEKGRLINGYDYDKQTWVREGKYIRCGHPEDMDCKCYGKIHAGEGPEWRKTRTRREEEVVK